MAKDSMRVMAYGSVDELSAAIGMALAYGVVPKLDPILRTIQNELFHLGSDLCFVEADKKQYAVPQIEGRHVDALEGVIDELNATVGPLENFVLPGGSVGAAHLHLARTICRRAEREALALSREEPIGPFVLPYLNRLSDALFVMARYENHERHVGEPLWNSKA